MQLFHTWAPQTSGEAFQSWQSVSIHGCSNVGFWIQIRNLFCQHFMFCDKVGSKKVLSTASASSQWELRMKGGLGRAGYKTPHTFSCTKPCPVWEGGTHYKCKRYSDHCTQDHTVELHGIYPVLIYNRPPAPLITEQQHSQKGCVPT